MAPKAPKILLSTRYNEIFFGLRGGLELQGFGLRGRLELQGPQRKVV